MDDELAVLLARRTALTAAVQDHKATTGEYAGQAGRDAEREAAIVARMAQRVPELGPERIARVLHTVIEESIAAWESGGGSDRFLSRSFGPSRDRSRHAPCHVRRACNADVR